MLKAISEAFGAKRTTKTATVARDNYTGRAACHQHHRFTIDIVRTQVFMPR
jgi:hypothetical protein